MLQTRIYIVVFLTATFDCGVPFRNISTQ